MRQSHTAVLARNEMWHGRFETEPYEVAWASEAIFFLRALEPANLPQDMVARVQVSPDGMHWCDEGSALPLPHDPELSTFVKVYHFGGWLRLAGELPDDASIKIIAYLTLKE